MQSVLVAGFHGFSFFLLSFSYMLLYQGPIYYEDEIQHLIAIVFLLPKISNSSQVKSELCVTYL